ncbi:hypothetical protein ACLPJK_25935 [Pseudomonas aeruginosa]|uniref:hypothetical protein n=1 Tax=Pseudomonas aeruginosa TaxID=287 RepID=UPI003D2956D7
MSDTIEPRTPSTVKCLYEQISARDTARGERYLTQFGPIPDNEMDEIYEQNRFWRRQLASLKVNTISERECLLDTLSAEDWLRHFILHVMPTVHRYNLPN